jgi:hypothetical protein
LTLYATSLASEGAAVQLKCRVIDTTGKPVQGVTVRLREISAQPSAGRQAPSAEGAGVGDEQAALEQLAPTGRDGMTTSGSLQPANSYVLEFEKDGYLRAVGHRSHPLDRGLTQLPDVQLRRLRTVRGKVTDRNGAPVAGAIVFQSGNGSSRTETTTAANGTFQIDNVPEGTALVFAQREGYWFRGVPAPEPGKPLLISLAATDRPNPDEYDLQATLPPDQPTEQSKARVLNRLLVSIRQAAEDGDAGELLRSFVALAWIDIDGADELLDKVDVTGDLRSRIRGQLIGIMARTDFDAATAMLPAIEDANCRAQAVYDLLQRSEDREQQQQLLGLALSDLRTTDDVFVRTNKVAFLYRFLWRAGEEDMARELVDQARRELEQTGESPTGRSVFGRLAERVAPHDPDMAISLLEHAKPMFAGWVAYWIAPCRPQEAARLIRNYEFGTGGLLRRWYVLPRVCYRMAPTDPTLARDLAELAAGVTVEFETYVPPQFKATAEARNSAAVLLKAKLYGFMARAILDEDPRGAQRLLREAVEMLVPLRAGARREKFIYTPAMVLASLVPTAARLDRGWAADLCWQAFALRFDQIGQDVDDAIGIEIAHGEILRILAALDRELAIALLEPLAVRAAARSGDGLSLNFWVVYAHRIVDAQSFDHWIDSLCDRPPSRSEMSPREHAERARLRQVTGNRDLAHQPTAQQAETWIHEALVMGGVVQDD